MASQPINLDEILEELFSRSGDGSDSLELDNFVLEIPPAQADSQVVLGQQWMMVLTSHAWMTQVSASTATREVQV